MLIVGLLLAWSVALTALYLVGRHWVIRQRSLERAWDQSGAAAAAPPRGAEPEDGFLRHWLALAGFRAPGAPAWFVLSTVLLTGLGALAASVLHHSALLRDARRFAGIIPGGVGDLLLPFTYLAPWAAVALPACLPWLLVRRARRRRVQEVEQDLPLTLELLATLGEAGLGFDGALDRILATQPQHRPLPEELRGFQLEILAGRPRVQCLRGLARRLQVSALTIFVSALVQAEQVGAGVANVLRRQSDDLRARRREEALTKAASLPVKLLFPLIVCFLPGIIVAALGPPFYQIFQLMETYFNKGLMR